MFLLSLLVKNEIPFPHYFLPFGMDVPLQILTYWSGLLCPRSMKDLLKHKTTGQREGRRERERKGKLHNAIISSKKDLYSIQTDGNLLCSIFTTDNFYQLRECINPLSFTKRSVCKKVFNLQATHPHYLQTNVT